MRQPQRRWLIPASVALFLILIDQISKAWIVAALGPRPLTGQIPLLGESIRFVYIHNTGVAFSLFQGMPTLLTVIAILISIGAVYVYAMHLPNEQVLVQISIGLIIGGALGNLIDRVRLGYVVDFIQVGWWPVFNLADSGITIGTLLLAGYLLFAGDATRDDSPPTAADSRNDALLSDLLRAELPDERRTP
ncbi:MAG: signal peptidase II [Chloroflexaceae bacterium]|nr:signal peptidase II [Chloroflexaceae bacterium]